MWQFDIDCVIYIYIYIYNICEYILGTYFKKGQAKLK